MKFVDKFQVIMLKCNYAMFHYVFRNAKHISARQFSAISYRQKIKNKFSEKISTQRTFAQNISACWHCKQDTKTNNRHSLFCDNCGSIREVNNNNDYFAIIGLERKFDINTDELTTKFRQLQSIVHPDKFGNRSSTEQSLSADWSSLINKAYKTLSTPIKRGEYLLKLNGVEIPEGNTAAASTFLLEMMERNEEVADTNDPKELIQLLDKVRNDLKATVIELENSLEQKNLDKAKENVTTLRYLISLENSIKSKNTRLGITE